MSDGMSDPDTLTAPVSEHRFPCDQCGSDLRYDPAAALLVCDHCGNTDPIEGHGFRNSAITELDLRRALAEGPGAAEMEETRVTTCPNCAAQVEFDPDRHATECPFCATPVVIDTGIHRHIKPRAVLPFALTEEQARRAMTDWLGRL